MTSPNIFSEVDNIILSKSSKKTLLSIKKWSDFLFIKKILIKLSVLKALKNVKNKND